MTNMLLAYVIIAISITVFVLPRESECIVYCEDGNALPWNSLGISCPIQCSSLQAAIYTLKMRETRELLEYPDGDYLRDRKSTPLDSMEVTVSTATVKEHTVATVTHSTEDLDDHAVSVQTENEKSFEREAQRGHHNIVLEPHEFLAAYVPLGRGCSKACAEGRSVCPSGTIGMDVQRS